MADFDAIARGLQGFGAGVAGRGPEFIQGLQQQEQRLDNQRKNALLQDSFTVMQNLKTGDISGAREVLMSRLEAIKQLGGDPSDTLGVLRKLESGDVPGAFNDVSTVVNFAQAQGLLKQDAGQQTKRQIVGGQVVSIDPSTGQATAAPIQGFEQDQGAARDRALRERQIAVSEAAEKRQTSKMSAGLEKALITSQDRVVEAQRNANEFDVLASDFERLNLEGGVKSSFTETLKGILGTQDDVSEFRRRFNKVRLSEGLKNLPPGPATDRDVQEAFKGVPKDNASSEQVASFLRGAARLARFESGYNQFKADFISGKSSAKGLNSSWRKKMKSSALNRSVSVAEIYETAQNRGVTPEEVASQLGVEGGLF